MKILITKNDIEEFWAIGKNIDNNRLLPHIRRAQETDLKPFLGEEFYHEFLTNFTSAVNQALFNGGTYSYQNKNIFFGGVKELLSSWAYARLYAQNPDFVTRGGNTRKDTDESEPQNQNITNTRATEAESEAIRLQAEAWQFLDQKRDDYPLWQIRSSVNDVTRQSFKITKVQPSSLLSKAGF